MSATAGRAAGGFVGGIANNPGIVAIAGIGITIGLVLLFFQNDIRKFFNEFQLPSIELPTINLPDITFPTFEFPDITFPTFEFPDINIGFPDINIGLPGVPDPFVGPERMDVPFGDTETIIDIVPDVTGGRGERLRDVIGPPEQTIEELFPDQPVSISDFINRFTGGPQVLEDDLVNVGRPDIPFAVANVEETQAEFQERAAAFVEAAPELTRATSLPGSAIVFGEQLSRESEDFEDALAAEARRSESIFAGLFGNVQNPDFEGA